MFMKKSKKYLEIDVLSAARERISFIFDEFKEIQVSVSGGKDSTVLLHLALQEAEKRNRKIEVFFLDQEAEYQATIDLIKKQMSHDLVVAKWYQVPIYLTNTASYNDYFLYAWGENQNWIREKNPMAIHQIEEEYPKRFYEIFNYLEKKNPHKAYLVGLRADESITRYRAVTKFAGYKGLKWSTISGSGANRFYPIYDWCWNDVWRFIYDYNIPYNKMYDLMFWDNYSVYKMRVSNLIHEKSFKCLKDLPKFEPETYDKLCSRISGIATASRYVMEKLIFDNKKLPKHYKNWKEFKDFLLENIGNEDHKKIFIQRFSKHEESEIIYKKQVKQLLLNDYENSCVFDPKAQQKFNEIKEKWKKIL